MHGHQKTKETSKFLKIVDFKKGIGIKRYTTHHSYFDYQKVPKQDEQVSLLRI